MDETYLKSFPTVLPVMVLEGCVLFPHGMLPLYIFEPRYQEMLVQVLGGDCLMGVVTRLPKPPHKAWEADDPRLLGKVTTMALVKACVRHEDGTAHLMLHGLERVRIQGWNQVEPYRVAIIEPYPTAVRGFPEALREEKSKALVKLLLEILEEGPNPPPVAQQMLHHMKNPEVLVDFVAEQFLGDSAVRYEVLELRRLKDRLDFLMEYFAKLRPPTS